jgi:hypothetical protein
MVFIATFNNISVISWQSVLLVEETKLEYPERTTELSQVDHMVVGFITTYTISAYHHESCEFEFRSWRGVLDTTVCDKVCQ